MLAQVKKRRQWRGTDRGRLRKLQKALLMMTARDQRMAANADATGDFGFYFDETAGNTITAAMQLIMDRIDACLNATV